MIAFLVKIGSPRRERHGARYLFLSGAVLIFTFIFFFFFFLRAGSRTARLLRALKSSSSTAWPHPQGTGGSVAEEAVSDENATESEKYSPLVAGHKSIGHSVVDGRKKVAIFERLARKNKRKPRDIT